MDGGRFLTISRPSDCLSVPIKASSRLKYNCVAVSSSIICLGTNTGSTYVFERESLKLIKFISSKSGDVDILEFSKDNKLLAIADSGGTVTCLEIDEEKHSVKVVKEIEDHKGSKLTCLCWDDSSARLFVGDERGTVTAIIVAPFKLPAGKFLSKSTIEAIVKGESPIVQLDYARLKLLISTTTRTLLCLTDRSKYQQVGSKPRDGKFGSCFVQFSDGEFPVIYAARPGSRLWEVDFSGQVLATHQFKYLLAVPPSKIYGCKPQYLHESNSSWDMPQSVAFPKLYQLCNRYLLTWSPNGIYILNPSLGKVSGWYDAVRGIKDVCCYDDSVYVLFNDGQIAEFEFLPVKSCLKTLLAMNEHVQAGQVALEAKEEILNHVEQFLTIDFDSILETLHVAEDQYLQQLHDSLQNFVLELHCKHDMVRSEIQERLNRMASLDDSPTTCDSGVEDNDDVRSIQSEVISETSSRLSLSRLPQIDMDTVLRRATSAVVNKIVSSGFMKKALKEVLESDANYCNDQPTHQPTRSPLQTRKFLETSEKSPSLSRDDSLEIRSRDSPVEPSTSNVEGQSSNFLPLVDENTDGSNLSKRVTSNLNKRRKKAKIVTVDFESPQKEIASFAQSYDVPGRSQTKRHLSLDDSLPYAPTVDIKRLSSLPHTALAKDFEFDQQIQLLAGQESPQMLPAIFEQAKQLVRKVIHPELPPPFDVGPRNCQTRYGSNSEKYASSPSYVEVSYEALKHVAKLVDVTAVCRNKIRDPRVLFNSKAVRKILQDWAEKLCQTVSDFSEILLSDIRKVTNIDVNEQELLTMKTREEFFSSLGAAFSEVSNLALLCFETGIFPVACSRLNTLEMSLINHELSLADVRITINESLNNGKENAPQTEVPQVVQPSTLLLLAKGHVDGLDTTNSKKFYICEEDSNENSVSCDEPCVVGSDERSEIKTDNSTHVNELTKNVVSEDLRELLESNPKSSDQSDGNDHGTSKKTEIKMDESSNHDLRLESVSKRDSNINDSSNAESKGPYNKDLNTDKHEKLLVEHEVSKANDSSSRTPPNLRRSPKITSSTLKEYVDIDESDVFFDSNKVHFFPESIESILCSSDDPRTCQSCIEDHCRACFVLRYFPLLDLQKIRTVLNWKQGCRWRTFLSYLVHLEDVGSLLDVKQAMRQREYWRVARIVRDSANVEPFFFCVRWLFTHSPNFVIDICTEKLINAWEVSFMYMANNGKHGILDDFLNYISAMRRIKPITDFNNDISVAMTTLYCSLKQSGVDTASKCYCDCGGARRGSHMMSWLWMSHIDDVIEWFLNFENMSSGVLQRALRLCRDFGYWIGCIKIYRHTNDHISAFKLLWQLGDLKYLDDYVKEETFTISEEDLRHLFQLRYHTLDVTDASKCRPAVAGFIPTVNCERIARLIIRELGTRKALKLLKDFDGPEFRLSDDFYFDCMTVSEKEMEQRSIAMKTLETLNSETFIEHKSAMHINIELMKNQELSGCLDTTEPSFQDDLDTNQSSYRESVSPTHWGVNLNLSSSNCPCCTLPLCIHGASARAGLVVFECGHTFHRQCIPEEACLVCYYGLESNTAF